MVSVTGAEAWGWGRQRAEKVLKITKKRKETKLKKWVSKFNSRFGGDKAVNFNDDGAKEYTGCV